MINLNRKEPKRTALDEHIDATLVQMETLDRTSDEYAELLSQYERLTALKTDNGQGRVSRDTLALVIGNLVGILIIVAYEQKHVLSSKSLPQIIRPMR